MRLPLTRDGFGVLAVTTVILAVLGWLGSMWTPWLLLPPIVVWGWAVSFFRDPERRIEHAAGTLYAPADGKITEVREIETHALCDGPCVRIRIFLSIFNVHINRMPCAATVRKITLKPGLFLNAMNPQSAEDNESNTLELEPDAPWKGPVIVRQISGLIARTIVCHAREGQRFASGERFGMIKFGSGTEIVLPRQAGLEILVREGQSVRAGLTSVAVLTEAASAAAAPRAAETVESA